MFEFLRTWRTNSRIRALEAQLQVRPTPPLYLQLADAYREAGNSQKAAQILKLGASRFPSSPEIGRRQVEAAKVERENEKRRLHDRIQTHPNPILYARLAELYKADGDGERTVQICQAGIKAFPRYGGSYLVLGQLFVEREAWLEAMGQLEKAVGLDKYNYMALKLLAQVYIKLSRPADAARRLEDILYFAPGDEAILGLLKKAKEAAGEVKVTDTSAVARGPVEEPKAELRRTQVLRHPETPRPEKPTVTPRDRLMNEGIARLRQVKGVQGALLVDQYGLVVAASLEESLDEGLAGALITNIYRTSSGGAPKLGVGIFEDGIVEAENGNVHIVQCGEMVLALFYKASVKMGMLEQSVREFAATLVELPH